MWLSKVKDFFKNSETIFLARAETLVGFVVSATALMDWSPLLGVTELSWKQALSIGGVMVAKGILTEWARRRNADL